MIAPQAGNGFEYRDIALCVLYHHCIETATPTLRPRRGGDGNWLALLQEG
jgi:hypothetical protein